MMGLKDLSIARCSGSLRVSKNTITLPSLFTYKRECILEADAQSNRFFPHSNSYTVHLNLPTNKNSFLSGIFIYLCIRTLFTFLVFPSKHFYIPLFSRLSQHKEIYDNIFCSTPTKRVHSSLYLFNVNVKRKERR
jgi:hypothetical protein